MVRISNIELIKKLMKNSRIPYVELAREFNVSETAIRKRIRKLEEEKIIKAYTVDLDIRKLGYKIHALIGIDTTPEDYISVINELKKNEEIISLYSSTGDHMLLLEIWFKGHEDLMNFTKYLENLKGVTRVCPAILLEKLK